MICMALIANLQYAWTLFVDPIHVARGWSLGGNPVGVFHLHRHGNLADARRPAPSSIGWAPASGRV